MSGTGFHNFCAAAMVLPSVDALSEDDAGHPPNPSPKPKAKPEDKAGGEPKAKSKATTAKPKPKPKQAKPKESPMKRPASNGATSHPKKPATCSAKKPAVQTEKDATKEPPKEPVKIGMCFYKRDSSYGYKVGKTQVFTVPSLHLQALIAPMFDLYS